MSSHTVDSLFPEGESHLEVFETLHSRGTINDLYLAYLIEEQSYDILDGIATSVKWRDKIIAISKERVDEKFFRWSFFRYSYVAELCTWWVDMKKEEVDLRFVFLARITNGDYDSQWDLITLKEILSYQDLVASVCPSIFPHVRRYSYILE